MYPEGVSLRNDMTYCLKVGSEEREILISLYESNDLSTVSSNNQGCLYRSVQRLMLCGYNPYKAFLRSFFERCPGVEIPIEFCCVETAAWVMAENVYKFDLWVKGEKLTQEAKRYFDTRSHFYDYSLKHLKQYWGIHEDHWKEVVLSLFPLEY